MKYHLCAFSIYLVGIMFVRIDAGAQTAISAHPSLTAFIVPERDAHLECISYDVVGNNFFLGSIHKRKIIKIDKKGSVSDFFVATQDSDYSVLGITVDNRRHIIWACTTALPEMEGYVPADKGKVSIIKLDFATGKIIKRYTTHDNGAHIFGEPMIAANGDLYISDSGSPNIYRIGKSDTLELFLQTTLKSLQGIAFNGDESTLFFSAYGSGLYRCDLKTKEISPLQVADTLNVKGTDGLYFYNNSLITIQNGVKPAMICQYQLNKEQTSIRSGIVLEKDHPAFNEPTSGIVVKNTFYYIANSQWSGYDKNQKILPREQLQDIKVMKLALRVF